MDYLKVNLFFSKQYPKKTPKCENYHDNLPKTRISHSTRTEPQCLDAAKFAIGSSVGHGSFSRWPSFSLSNYSVLCVLQ